MHLGGGARLCAQKFDEAFASQGCGCEPILTREDSAVAPLRLDGGATAEIFSRETPAIKNSWKLWLLSIRAGGNRAARRLVDLGRRLGLGSLLCHRMHTAFSAGILLSSVIRALRLFRRLNT